MEAVKDTLVRRLPLALWAAAILISLFGAVLDLVPDQAQRPVSHQERSAIYTQPPAYTGPAECLVEHVGQSEGCRGELPECLQEDGSGPGVLCWFTSDGLLWLQDGQD